MSRQIKKVLVMTALVAAFTYVPSAYALQIASWENTPDNCIDWAAPQPSIDDPSVMPSIYEYESAVGVTSGAKSLHVNQAGYAQRLALRLNAAGRTAFMANSVFSIDVSVAASDGVYTAGYTNIEEVAMNAPGAGFQAVASQTPLQFYWWGTAGARTQTLTINYSDFRQAVTATDYIEIVFTINTGAGAPDDIYFDNAQLLGGTGVLGGYQSEVMADDPALYLRLEENSVPDGGGNGTLTDSSGNGYWAAHRSLTQFIPDGGIGNCRYLTGVDGNNAIAAANAAAFPGWTFDFLDSYAFAPDDISFEFWFNSDANDLAPYAMFFQQVKTRNYQAPGLGNSGGTFRVLSGDPTAEEVTANAERWWYTNVPLPLDGRWHHVVVTYQETYGTADQMAIQFYLDGELAASTVVGDPTRPAKLGPEMDHVLLGGANDLGYIWNVFKGMIDEFAVYPGILPPDRVATHYGAGLCAMSKGDITGDCKVDMADFAQIASTWMLCNDPALFGSDPDCSPTW